jgi:predicted dehydrogenase
MLAYPYDTLFDCMMEWQIHNIDIMRMFVGDVADVRAFMKIVGDQRAAIAILMRFENGVVGTTHWGTEGGTNHGLGAGRGCERLEIVGSNSRVLVVQNDREVAYYHGNDAQTWHADWSPHSQNQSYVLDGYVGAIRHFTECIVSRTQPNPNIHDELKALEFVYEVARQLSIPQEWKVVEGKP